MTTVTVDSRYCVSVPFVKREKKRERRRRRRSRERAKEKGQTGVLDTVRGKIKNKKDKKRTE